MTDKSCIGYVAIGVVVTAAIAAVLWCCMSSNSTKKLRMLQSTDRSNKRGVRDGKRGVNSASNIANVARSKNAKKFTTLDPDRVYGAGNVVSSEGAGNQFKDCSYKNLTVNSRDDPIIHAGSMFPPATSSRDGTVSSAVGLARAGKFRMYGISESTGSGRHGHQSDGGGMALIRGLPSNVDAMRHKLQKEMEKNKSKFMFAQIPEVAYM